MVQLEVLYETVQFNLFLLLWRHILIKLQPVYQPAFFRRQRIHRIFLCLEIKPVFVIAGLSVIYANPYPSVLRVVSRNALQFLGETLLPLSGCHLLLLVTQHLQVVIHPERHRFRIHILLRSHGKRIDLPCLAVVHILCQVRHISGIHVIHHIEHHGTVIGTGRHDTSQLLVEHCLAVRRTKEEGRLYTRNVDTLVQHVNAENNLCPRACLLALELLQPLHGLPVAGVVVIVSFIADSRLFHKVGNQPLVLFELCDVRTEHHHFAICGRQLLADNLMERHILLP